MPWRVQPNGLVIEENSTPSTPASSTQLIYPKSGGKWAYKASNGQEVEIGNPTITDPLGSLTASEPTIQVPRGQLLNPSSRVAQLRTLPSPDVGKCMMITTDLASAGTSQFGTRQTANIGNTPTSSANANHDFQTVNTAAVANSLALTGTTVAIPSEDFIEFGALILMGSAITTMRAFVGLMPNSGGSTNADVPIAAPYIAFRFSASADATHWVPVAHNGTTASAGTAISTPVVAVSTEYFLKFRRSGSNVYFSINNGTEQLESSLNLPSISSVVNLSACLWVFTNAASVRTVSFSRMYAIYP